MMHTENIKDAVMYIKINQKTKDNVENILHNIGITMSQAINMYLTQIIADKSIPFDTKTPNKKTIKVIKEARAGKGLIKSKDINTLFNDLGI